MRVFQKKDCEVVQKKLSFPSWWWMIELIISANLPCRMGIHQSHLNDIAGVQLLTLGGLEKRKTTGD